MAWRRGDTVELRHLCRDRVWVRVPTYVVSDELGLLVTYLPSGAPITYEPGPWPTATGRHPWHPQPVWHGHGMLMLQRHGDAYGLWVFWSGAERAFDCWYLNIHEWSRDGTGCSINDLELDVVVRGGVATLKDAELVDVRVAEGRLTERDAAHARAVGAELVAMVERGETWWDPAWAAWAPPPGWDRR